MIKVFLGGSQGKINWRDELIRYLTIDYLNPLDSNEVSEEQKRSCDYYLYVITPGKIRMTSIIEAISISYKKPGRVIFVVQPEIYKTRFTTLLLDLLSTVGESIEENNGFYLVNIEMNHLALFLDALDKLTT